MSAFPIIPIRREMLKGTISVAFLAWAMHPGASLAQTTAAGPIAAAPATLIKADASIPAIPH